MQFGSVVALALIALHAVGCSTLNKQLNALNESTAKITAQVIPDWDKQCLDAAKTCADECKKKNAASSQPVYDAEGCKASCDPYQKCSKDRANFYTAVNSIHTSINIAIGFIQMGNENKAKQIYLQVVSALQKVYKIVEERGFSLKDII